MARKVLSIICVMLLILGYLSIIPIMKLKKPIEEIETIMIEHVEVSTINTTEPSEPVCEPSSEPTIEVIPFESIYDVAEEITEPPAVLLYDEDDVEILAKVVCYEAGGESREIQLLVANVVRNRVVSDKFPNTYYEVVTQPHQYGNLHEEGPFWPQWANAKLRDQCRDVARQILEGNTVCPDNVIFQAEFVQGTGIYVMCPGFYFCYG